MSGAASAAVLWAVTVSALAAEPPQEIVVVKRGDLTAHAQVAEEFVDHCRVRARVINLDRDELAPKLGPWPGAIVVAVGERALDAAVGARYVISALAMAPRSGVLAAEALPPPELVLRALKAARPSLRRIAVVHGPMTDALMSELQRAAVLIGLTVVEARAASGPQALSELHRIAGVPGAIEAIWLAPDPSVFTPQLFQYALQLEIEQMIPLVAVTRQQVKSGALLAIDADPRAVGRQAADLANRLLAGERLAAIAHSQRESAFDLIVNQDVARRLGVDVAALSAQSARFE